jgi:hypothetical protein
MALKNLAFDLHPKQTEAWRHVFRDKKRTTALISGIQGGKTIFGCFALRKSVQDNKDPNATWLVGAPTYKVMNQSTLPTFKKVFGPLLGNYNGQDGCYTLKDGRQIWFRTSTDPDSVEGIPDLGAGGGLGAWIDEAGKCTRRFWVNIEARLARCQGQLLLTTTWYSLNWLYRSIWQPYQQGTRDDIGLVYFNSSENPTFPAEELERQKHILSRAEFSRKFLGEPSKPEGLIYPEFNKDNWCEPFEINHHLSPTYMGIDWGFDHPFALVVRTIMGDRAYTVSIFKRSGLSVQQQIDVIRAKWRMFNVKMAFCGHDRPDMIQELNTAGMQCVKYFEGNNEFREVNAGNQKHGELIRTKKLQIFKGLDQSEDLEDEYLTYSWDKKESDEETVREKAVNINDDLMAAERYCTVGTMNYMKRAEIINLKPDYLAHRVDEFNPEELEKTGSDWMDY